MTKDEILKIKEHIEIHARREPYAIKITEIMWKAVAELEHLADLEKQLEAEKKLNEEIKVRFVKCNTCTDEMKNKCLMFSENLCEGDRCEELVDLMDLINKSDLQRENAELKKEYSDNLSLKDEELMCLETEFNTYKSGAKEIIRELMDIINHDLSCFDTIAGLHIKQKAEQFLKE